MCCWNFFGCGYRCRRRSCCENYNNNSGSCNFVSYGNYGGNSNNGYNYGRNHSHGNNKNHHSDYNEYGSSKC